MIIFFKLHLGWPWAYPRPYINQVIHPAGMKHPLPHYSKLVLQKQYLVYILRLALKLKYKLNELIVDLV